MTDRKAELFEAARSGMEKAHAPYSGFSVGAAVLAENGQIYVGCNVENASYPEGWCAETTAIAAMVMGGGKRIVEACVIGNGDALVTPCGGCRQRLREFASNGVPIHIAGPDGIRRTFTLEELLPASFGPENLEVGQ